MSTMLCWMYSLEIGRLARSLGLTRPTPGSLGVGFLVVLVGGAALSVWLGGLGSASAVRSWTLLASVILWQPLIEELLFRGVLQGELLRHAVMARSRYGVSVANLLVSVAFAGAHLVNQPPGWALATFLPSLLFGFFRDRTGSVAPGLLLHVAFNAGFFLAP
jgi:uncharacterized protein